MNSANNHDGEQSKQRITYFSIMMLVMVVGIMLPKLVNPYQLLLISGFSPMIFVAISLYLAWGLCGILSLGQAAFFGLSAYCYGIIIFNLPDVWGATLIAAGGSLLITTISAIIISYFVFYARLNGVVVAIITLIIAMMLHAFAVQTSDPSWSIGNALFGGTNGLTEANTGSHEIPSLSLHMFGSTIEFSGLSSNFYYLAAGSILVAYLILKAVSKSGFGLVLNAIREDQDRAELLGYDIRKAQTIVFSASALLAAYGGLLFISWGNFVTPDVFNLTNNILPIIWIAIAGRKSIAASIIGALLIQWISLALAIQGAYALLIQGTLIIIVVWVLPDGVVSLPTVISENDRNIKKSLKDIAVRAKIRIT